MGTKWLRDKISSYNKRLMLKKESETISTDLLFSIIDRKVFDVEEDEVTTKEFHLLSEWALSHYEDSFKNTRSGRIILEEPLIIIEVVENQPVYIEIQDYKAKYRVNIYHEEEDIKIQALEPTTEELQYNRSNQAPIIL